MTLKAHLLRETAAIATSRDRLLAERNRLVAALSAIIGELPDKWGYRAGASALNDEIRIEAANALRAIAGDRIPAPFRNGQQVTE